MEWTVDLVLKLATDPASARAGRELAHPGRWQALGRDDDQRACWGHCQGSGSTPYQAQIDLREPAFRCSCPSRKFPCKHALGLFLLYVAQPSAFASETPPPAVAEWLQKRSARAEAQAQSQAQARAPEPPADPSGAPSRAAGGTARASRAAGREAKVAAGLEELKQWLLDLVRQGLSSAQGHSYRDWDAMAARLIDAQAPGLARRVRELAGIASSGAEWHQRLLDRLGNLYLLIEGHSRIATLPAPIQADIRTRIGWTQDQKALLAEPGVRDAWHVLGRRTEVEERLRVQRTWLRGQATRRFALVLQFAPLNGPLESGLPPGTCFEAEIVYFPGSWPLRAIVGDRRAEPRRMTRVDGERSLYDATAEFAAALAVDPWIERLPLCLDSVTPAWRDGRWLVRDESGRRAELAIRGEAGWRLLACSGGRPIGVFGEWDGDRLSPLSCWSSEGFQVLPDPQSPAPW